jgi:hypothetical protein
MKQQPIKYFAVVTPILLVTGLCLSVKADIGKKFLTYLLTPEKAKKVFMSFK